MTYISYLQNLHVTVYIREGLKISLGGVVSLVPPTPIITIIIYCSALIVHKMTYFSNSAF